MAKKSKTQRAKASAKRAARKEEKARAAEAEAKAAAAGADENTSAEDESSKKSSKKADKAEGADKDKKQEKKSEKKKSKKRRFGFFKDVKAEMKRVTWPTKEEVLRWSGVVIVALIFFGLFAWIIDTLSEIVLAAISGLGASL